MNIRKIVFSCVTSIRNYCSSRVLPIRFVLFSRFTNKAIVTQQTVYQLLLQTKHQSLVVMCAIKVYNRHARLCLNHNNINLVGDKGIVISYKGNFLFGSHIIYIFNSMLIFINVLQNTKILVVYHFTFQTIPKFYRIDNQFRTMHRYPHLYFGDKLLFYKSPSKELY